MAFRRRQSATVLGITIYACATGAVALSPLLGGPFAEPLSAPHAAFWLVVIGATGCAVAAMALLVVAWRTSTAELGLLGSLLYAMSVLPLAHGLTLPDVLVGPNGATWTAALLSMPAASVAAVPLLAPHSRWGVSVARRWRGLVVVHVVAVTALASALTAWPQRWPVPDSHNMAVLAFGWTGMLCVAALGWRHLRLYLVGRHIASLIAGLGFVHIAASGLVWAAPAAYTPGWWGVHLLDISGVFLAIGGIYLSRPNLRVRQLLDPVLNADPLVALELGLSPTIAGFVQRLGDKDEVTRQHLVRAADLAMRLGVRASMSPTRLRTLGLAALLHDIGKVAIDDTVLTKPGQLTPMEYEAVKAHSAHGWEMLQDEPTLRAVAPLVRGHHERPDGKGYPDGLSGQQISLDQGLISAVDAYDAMTHTRQYRAGMDQDRAVQILRGNVGTQFLGPAVDLLLAHLEQEATVPTVNPFAHLGIREEAGQDTGEVCGTMLLPT